MTEGIGKLSAAQKLDLKFFISPQVADSYMKLSSWNEVAEWQKHISSLRKQCLDSDVQHSLMANVDMNYVK